MTLIQRTSPSSEPISLAQAKHYLRIGNTLEDTFVADLIAAARQAVENHAGLALITRAVRQTFDRWALQGDGVVELAMGPVSAIDAIRVVDPAGSMTLVEPETYRLDGQANPPRLHFKAVPRAPARTFQGIEIDFLAGFGAPADVPAALQQACLIVMASFYQFRGTDAPLPAAAAALIGPFQRPKL
jgi:uncharacterized phiE125 gp8 family phage protein